ncbi:MAG: hypothetical protein ABIJ14_01645 [Nanoarchaeota archaeon]|nr:hypothetical protein [Nanoarchaeota archaeon]
MNLKIVGLPRETSREIGKYLVKIENIESVTKNNFYSLRGNVTIEKFEPQGIKNQNLFGMSMLKIFVWMNLL